MISSVFPEAKKQFKEAVLAELNDVNFKWNEFVDSLIEEDSPLQEVFDKTTVKYADIYDKARRLHQSLNQLNSNDVSNSQANLNVEIDWDATDLTKEGE